MGQLKGRHSHGAARERYIADATGDRQAVSDRRRDQPKHHRVLNAEFEQQNALVAPRNLITRFGDQIGDVYPNDETMARAFISTWCEANGDAPTPPITGISG